MISVGVSRWMGCGRDVPYVIAMDRFTLGRGMDYVNICNSLNAHVGLVVFICH